jgi:hypothetical protein
LREAKEKKDNGKGYNLNCCCNQADELSFFDPIENSELLKLRVNVLTKIISKYIKNSGKRAGHPSLYCLV